MKINKLLAKRVLAIIVSILTIMNVAPTGVISTFAQSASQGVVESVTAGVNIATEDSVFTAYADAMSLQWLDMDEASGRENAGWAVGVKITAPESMTVEADFKTSESEFAKYKEKMYGDEDSSAEKVFWDNQHSDKTNAESIERYMMLWAYVNEEAFNDAKMSNKIIKNEWTFDWNGDGTYDQTVVIEINPFSINLVKEENVVYPSASLADIKVSDGAGNDVPVNVTCNKSNFVTIETSNETIIYADETEKCVVNVSVTPVEDFTDTTVCYQQMSNSGWINCEYTEQTESIQLLTTLNVEQLKNGEDTISQWRFDWDGDGVYEQMITLTIDADKVVLANSAKNQFYPELGSVIVSDVPDMSDNEVITMSGDKTGYTKVEVKKIALGLRVIDSQESWWAKTVIKAPDNISAEALQDVTYKKFDENTNTNIFVEGNLVDGLIVWMEVTPTLLGSEEYIQYTMDIDYNGDANFSNQTVVCAIKSSSDIVLLKKDQTELAFGVANVEAQWIGKGTYKNDTLTGGSGSGDVMYSLTEESKQFASIDAVSGEVTYLDGNFPADENSIIGTITVIATKAEDEKHNEASAQYSFMLVKNSISDKLLFSHGPSIEVIYGKDSGDVFQGNVFTNPAKNSAVITEGASLKYQISEQTALDGSAVSGDVATVDESGKVTVLRSGIVKVRASVSETKNYAAGYAEYTLTIQKGEQNPLAVSYLDIANIITYSPSDTADIEVIKDVTGGTTGGKITFLSTNEEVAAVDPQTGKVKTNKVGTFSIEIVMAGDDCYNDVTITTENITIIKADQEAFAFEYETPETVYNKENSNIFENKTIGGSGNGTVIYTIAEECKDIVELTGTNGNVKIKKAGIATVTAVKSGDGNYNDAIAVYTLIIQSADQEIKFDQSNVTLYYGTIEFSANALSCIEKVDAADGKGYGDGAVTYSISQNTIGATIDEVTGFVSFTNSKTKVGVVTVEATKAGDSCYNECKTEYTIEVEYAPVPQESYTITGNKGSIDGEETGWYVGDITITAPAGYSIGYGNEITSDSWADEIVINTDGIYNGLTVYYKDANGYITDAVFVEELKRDTVAISFDEISYKEPGGLEIIGGFLGSIFGSTGPTVDVTVKLSDLTSGIHSLKYSVNGGATYTDITDKIINGVCEFEFEGRTANKADIRYIAIDNAGNKVEYSDGVTIIFNNNPPELKTEYVFDEGVFNSVVENEKSTLVYCNNNVTVEFIITEQNFESLSNSGIKPILTINGEERDLTWEKTDKENVYKASATLECAENSYADYEVVCSYDNNIYEKVESVTNIIIDREEAVITFDANDDEIKNTIDDHLYYDAAQTFEVTIKDHTFTAENVEFVVTGEKATAELMDYLNEYKNPDNWSQNAEGAWVANVTFDIDAEYEIQVYYIDMARNESKKLTKEFTIDTGAPNTPMITYGKSVLNTIIEGITFGVFDAPVEVTVTSSDSLSGVDRIEYAYISTEGDFAYDSIDVRGSEKTDEKITFSIPADEEKPEGFQFRGIVSATAYDVSQNKSETTTSGTDKLGNKIDGVVFDTISPERVVIPSEAQQVVDKTTMAFIDDFIYSNENQNAILYYNDKATVTFFINEANFVAEDVDVRVNDTPVAVDNWEYDEDNNNFKGEITLSEEGSYIVTLGYEDRANNKMEKYTSEQIVIDKTPVEIDFKYNEADVVTTENDLKYFDYEQTVVISVNDEVLYVDEFDLEVTATDFNGNVIDDIDVDAYATKASSIDNWAKSADGTWNLSLDFSADAEYSIKAVYYEAAKNKTEVSTGFVVDKTAPQNLDIKYSKSVFNALVETLTFGYYKSSGVIAFEATDDVAGLDKFVINATTEGSAIATNVKLPKDCVIDLGSQTVLSGETGFAKNYTIETSNEKTTVSIVVPAQFRGKFIFDAIDRSSNKTSYADEKAVITDSVNPKVEITYSGALRDMVEVDKNGKNPSRQSVNVINADTRFVYGGIVTATVKIAEANFYPEDVIIRVKQNGKEIQFNAKEWTVNVDEGVHSREIIFDADGDYQLFVEYSDRSANAMDYSDILTAMSGSATYKSNIITVDTIKPVMNVTYDNNTSVENKYYGADRTATITIDDRNFRPNEVKLVVKSEDIGGNKIEYNNSKLVSWSDWTQNGTVWTAKLPFNKDGNYTVDLTYTDIAQNKVETDYHAEFTVDKTAPENLEIIYSESLLEKVIEGLTFGYYKADATVTIKATDTISGVKSFNIDVKTNGSTKATDVELPEKLVIGADGAMISGKSGFISDVDTKYESIGTTSVSFKVPAQYRGEFIFFATDETLNKSDTVDDKNILVVDTISPVFNVTYAGDLKDKVEKDGEKISRQTVSVVDENTRFVYSSSITATLTIEEANFYGEDVVVTVEHDGKKVDNFKMTEWKKDAYSDVYTSTITLEDDGDYVLTVEYIDRSTNDMDYSSDEFTDKKGAKTYISNILSVDTVKPEYSVSYDNNSVNGKYYNKNRTATVEITDRNFRPNEVEIAIKSTDVDGNTISYNYSSLTSWSDWKQNGITWTANIPFLEDGNYVVDITYTDIAGHKIEEDFHDEFTVDKVSPNELTIEYSESVLEKIIEGITFGYYKADAVVTLAATDTVAGVEYFTLDSKPNSPDVSTNVLLPNDLVINADGNIASGTAGFVSNVAASSAGGVTSVSFKVPAQCRGEFMFSATDRAKNESAIYDDNNVVVVDNVAPGREVIFTPTNIVSESTMLDVETFDEDDNVVLYYNEDAVVTFKIKEANFYEEDVNIEVNGISQTVRDWTNSGDEWTGTLTLSDEGDYVITVNYKDRSGNEMVTYESHRLVIDKTAPVITVIYSDDIQNTLKDNASNDRNYYDKTQVATVLVKEHNFRADDVLVKVAAKDVLGNNVMTSDENGCVVSFMENGKDRSAWSPYESGTWRRTDDGFIFEITYEADANYTFDVEYIDMAKNIAADYEPDYFTVDKTVPEKLEVIYGKTTILEQVLENISFGFYNAQMTVTITAEDITSGVHHFVYSYINSEGVSSVNAQLLDQAISAAEIKYIGSKASAMFTVPKLLLKNDNQFNGTVKFSAFDRAENQTEKADVKRIVVDNIRPTAEVKFNQPVKTAGSISYYASDINATIVINEANFFSSDVDVTVTKDGSNYPINVKWVDNSPDIHTGTFTIKGDGDYVVFVRYRDKSANEMAPIKSNQLTIDSVIPKIDVSNVKNNSANKDKKYGFTITASDHNIDASTFNPKLTAVVKNDDKTYSTVNVPLGNVKTIKAGEVYSVSVENLVDDAVYTMSGSVKDMAANVYSKVILEDGKEYENVVFSINRKGSTFTITDEYTAIVMGNYYVKEVSKNIIIDEINVDPVENYDVTLNGKKLVEGEDFTTTTSNNVNEWFKRSYILKPELFEEENVYRIVIESVDKANSKAYSDVKLLDASFVVDKTEPKFVISGMETGGRYSTHEQTVTVIPTDDGGKLQLFKVIIVDSKGNPIIDEVTGEDISVRFEKSGADLLEYLELHGGKVTFTIPEGYQQQVKIICRDSAVDSDGLSNEFVQVFENVTVSQSKMIIFFANKPLFYGVTVGSVSLIGGIIFLILRKKRKQDEE